ncbi:MAG: DUF4168 domain-containing protein [Phormidesmis sp.]
MSLKNNCYRRVLLAIASGAFLSAVSFTQLGNLLSTGRLSEIMPAAYAQTTTDEDVTNYARAVSAIETQRQLAYESASDVLTAAGSEKSVLETPLSCQAHRLKDMPSSLSKSERVSLLTVLVDFCRQARATAETNNLTPQRFNSITTAQKEDPELAKRIKTAISELPASES